MVQYLHFRILEFPLSKQHLSRFPLVLAGPFQRPLFWGPDQSAIEIWQLWPRQEWPYCNLAPTKKGRQLHPPYICMGWGALLLKVQLWCKQQPHCWLNWLNCHSCWLNPCFDPQILPMICESLCEAPSLDKWISMQLIHSPGLLVELVELYRRSNCCFNPFFWSYNIDPGKPAAEVSQT